MSRGRPKLKPGQWGQTGYYKEKTGLHVAYARVGLYDGTSTKRERKGKTKSQANEALEQLKKNFSNSNGSTITRDTFLVDLCQEWINEKRQDPDIGDTTKELYQRYFDTHIKRDLPKLKIGDITTGNFSRYLKNKPPSIAHQLKLIATNAIEIAVEEDALERNPIRESRKPKRKKVKESALPEKLIHEFLDYLKEADTYQATGTPVYEIMIVSAGTGARTGEVLGLRWEDIDFDNEYISITGTAKQNKAKGIHRQNHPKTKAGFRELEVLPYVFDVLREVKKEAFCRYVFPSRKGTVRSENNFNRARRTLITKSGREDFKKITITKVRKAVSSYLKQKSNGLELSRQQLGHSSIKVTEEHYNEKTTSHVSNREFLTDFSKPFSD